MSPHWCNSSRLPLAGQSHPLCALLTSFPNCNSLLWAADSFVVVWLLITFPCENTTSPVGADDRGSPRQLCVPRAGRLQTLAATCLCFYCRVHSLFFSTPWITNAFPCEAWTHTGVFLSGFRCKYQRRNWALWHEGCELSVPTPLGAVLDEPKGERDIWGSVTFTSQPCRRMSAGQNYPNFPIFCNSGTSAVCPGCTLGAASEQERGGRWGSCLVPTHVWV